MKFTWGKGIFLVMTGFAVLMASFMFRAYHAQEELVAENYYEQEIRYQQQIDKLDNVSRLGGGPELEVVANELVISFPATVQDRRITGELYLQRPSDARFDDRMSFDLEPGEELRVPVGDRMKGLYSAQLEWRTEQQEYLTVEKVYVP